MTLVELYNGLIKKKICTLTVCCTNVRFFFSEFTVNSLRHLCKKKKKIPDGVIGNFH